MYLKGQYIYGVMCDKKLQKIKRFNMRPTHFLLYSTLIPSEVYALRRHPFYLMPYPIFKEKSDTLEFNEFVTNHGEARKSRQLEIPLDVITKVC